MPAPGILTAERYRRLRALNPILATDNYVLQELANQFGVTVQTILNDREYIQKVWWTREENESTLGEREKQAEMYKMLRREALESWKLSKKGREEITTRFVDKPCEDCNSTGSTMPGVKCFNCDGTGHVTEEVTLKKVDGSPGDPSYIREARQCTDSICKLLGLNKPVVEKIQHHIDHEHKHIVKLDSRFDDADPEDLLAVKAALARLEESSKQKTIEGTVVKKENEDETS
jgi:hypothetical protein